MIELTELPRQLDAVVYAAKRLGYNVREVTERMDKIRNLMAVRPYGPDIRQYMINMRGYDMPPQFGTSLFLDLQLERLIDMLASDEQRAEMDALARRLNGTLMNDLHAEAAIENEQRARQRCMDARTPAEVAAAFADLEDAREMLARGLHQEAR
jgi:hypothetical protein